MFDTKISLYGIFIIISIISGLFFVYKNTKMINLNQEEKIGLLMYIGFGTIFGAKYFTYFINPQKYNGVFEFAKIGLSSYGAIFGIILLLLLFSKQYKKSFKDLIYILLPSIPLMYGIGKIGCFLAGCCYGVEYSGPLSIVYNYSYSAPKGVHLFPIQLLEAITFILIFIYIFNKIKKEKTSNIVIEQTFIICGVAKFLLDYLRMNHIGQIITINQIASLIFILIGIFMIINDRKKELLKVR